MFLAPVAATFYQCWRIVAQHPIYVTPVYLVLSPSAYVHVPGALVEDWCDLAEFRHGQVVDVCAVHFCVSGTFMLLKDMYKRSSVQFLV